METENSIFKFLFLLFKRHKINCVLIGGYALIANKVQRLTFDIDFIITLTDLTKIEPEIIETGYSIFNRQDAFVQFKSERHGYRDLDFLITDQYTIEKLISQGRKISITGETFFIPSLEHLIAMKLHSMINNQKREIIDYPDIVQLMIANTIDPEKEEIINIFKKYKAMDIHEKLIKDMEKNK
jgi:hypothetical protein